MSSRLEKLYNDTLRSELQKKLKLKNVMQVPRLSKIVLNVGVKEAVNDGKILNNVKEVIDKIAGQASVKTLAKKSIAGFKLREGSPIGVMVTLRKDRMYNFLEKLINLALPAVRDFQGVTTKFDGRGGYNLGITDWFVFPEVDYDVIDRTHGINISIHTTAEDDNAAYELLKGFSMPFRKESK
jgi:large subunit ribosomal protein L5